MAQHHPPRARAHPDASPVRRAWQRLAAAWWPWFEPEVLGRLARRSAALGVLGVVVGIMVAGAHGTSYSVDERAIGAVASNRTSGTVELLDTVGKLAGFTTVAAIGGSFAIWARWRTGTWRLGQLVAVAVGGALAVVGTVKLAVPRDRPDAAMFDAISSAFPSGHAARGAVVLGLATWLITRRPGVRHGRLLWTAAGVLVLIIAGSRVYSGMHWPSDVAAGLVIGGGWLWLVLTIADERGLATTARKPPSAPGPHVPDAAP